MEEHDRLEDGSKILVQTLKLMLIGLGLVVIQFLGWSVFMPIVIGLAVFVGCTSAMKMVQALRNPSGL